MAPVTPFPTPDAWTRTVQAVAAQARALFHDLGERLDKAVALVLSGTVDEPDVLTPTHYTVASQRDKAGLATYAVVVGKPSTCTCEDFTRHATQGAAYQCKHILSVWLYRRALAQHAPTSEPEPVAPAVLPEAALSLCLRGTLGASKRS